MRTKLYIGLFTIALGACSGEDSNDDPLLNPTDSPTPHSHSHGNACSRNAITNAHRDTHTSAYGR